ncbi:MAG: cytochrome c biogenesis protein CcsA [Caldisericia bacterium]|nr:cytochrome c biogenesis protein CcsA [Caldisericia bacterium]
MPGTVSLYLIIAVAVAGIITNPDRRIHSFFAWAQLVLSGFITAFTLYGIFKGWYCYQYIFHNSQRSLPTIYKLSVLWSGDAGSLILWLLMMSIVVFILSAGNHSKRQGLRIAYPLVIMISVLIVLADPFKVISPVPDDGMGLGVLLQNPWMVSHPPVVFASYALMAIPFVLTIIFLSNPGPQNIPAWRKAIKPWLIASWLLLGVGILLGAVWAYETLGWGGYWGWDPVENSSLVPWLLLTVAIHAVIIDEGTNLGLKAAVGSVLASFISMLAAVFITRSGALSDLSVHTFSGSNWAFWIILAGFVGYSVFSVISVWKSWKLMPSVGQTDSFSKPVVMGIGNIAITVFALLVLVATILPMFGGMSLTHKYYQTILVPVAVIMLVGSAISPLQSWKILPVKEFFKKMILPIVMAVLLVLVIPHDGDWMMIVFSVIAGFCIGANLVCVANTKFVKWGSYLAHIGLAILALGVVASSIFQDSNSVILARNVPAKVGSYSIVISSFDMDKDGSKFISTYKLQYNSEEIIGTVSGKWDAKSRAWVFVPSTKNRFPKNIMVSFSSLKESIFFDLTMAKVADRGEYRLEVKEFKDSSAVVTLSDGKQKFNAEVPYDEMNPEPVVLEDNLELLYRGDGTFALSDKRPDRKGTVLFTVTVSERRLLDLLWFGSIIMMIGIALALLKSLYKPKKPALIGMVKTCEC